MKLENSILQGMDISTNAEGTHVHLTDSRGNKTVILSTIEEFYALVRKLEEGLR